MASSIRMRARRRASVSSDSVTVSCGAPMPPGDEAQPASAVIMTQARPAQAKTLLGSQAVEGFFMISCLLRAGRQGRHLLQHHGALLCDALFNAGAVLDVASQLAARGVNVVPSGFAHSGDDTSI